MMRRVVVTGMGAITPMGLNVEEFFENVKAGNHGFGMITRFDASEYKAKVAAEVKGFVGKNYMDFKSAKRMELFSQYAVAATKEALEQSGLDMEKEDPFRVGVSIGSGIGGLETMEREYAKLTQKPPSPLNPPLVPPMIPKDNTPKRLLALTRRSSFSIQIADLNSLAFCIKKVAGRACNPTWFCTITSFTYIVVFSSSFFIPTVAFT